MGILTDEMQRLVRRIRLGYVATVCPDGTPNLSPKGTTTVWDDDHLVFADLRSPNTVANLRHNPMVEINVVDRFSARATASKAPRRCSPKATSTS
jgi:predicted pyridoxine 5'-phosphate oxidase superfamily flavin-nucleotide-binding protein